MRITRMIGDEFLEHVFDLRPPLGVVFALRLRVIIDVDARAHEVPRERFYRARGVQAVQPAVHHEQWLVAEIIGKDVAVVDLIVGEHHDETVERDDARKHSGVAHGDEVRAASAVGDAGERDVVLIDVVSALEPVDDRVQIEDLVVAPPGCVFPGVRKHINLFGARQRSNFAGPSRFIVGPRADSPVKLKPDLIPPRRVVCRWNVDGVEVLDPVLGVVAQQDHAGFLSRIGSAKLQSAQCVVKRGACLHNFIGERSGLGWGIGRPELLKRGFHAGALRVSRG